MRWLVAAVIAAAMAGVSFAADGTTRNFDLTAGDAMRTLNQFAQQADCEIIFPAETLKGVETRAVSGMFTPDQALARLVAGTDLVVARSEKSGMFAVTRRKAPRMVRLPPYIVTVTSGDLPWRYAAIPGFEILSCCPNLETQEFIENIYRLQASLDEIVPSWLQARSVVPTTLILLSEEVQRAMVKDIATLAAANTEKLNAPSLIPQIRLWDDDAIAVDIVLEYRGPGGYSDIGFTPNYFLSLLGKRVPPLPSWFIAGVLNLYQDLYWPAAAAARPSAITPDRTRNASNLQLLFNGSVNEDDLADSTDNRQSPLWIPPETPGSLRGLAALQKGLPPMGQLFNSPLVKFAGAREDGKAALRAEAVLFVRWAFDDESFKNRNALWRWVERSGAGPVDEAVFRDCFGFGFEEMRRKLSDYLPIAMKDGFLWNQSGSSEIPSLDLRDATMAEKARILGDWERMEIEFVQSSHPEYAPSYIDQADRTLRRAYQAGERDPGFLAVLGLYECTLGDDTRARGFLEAAVHAGAARPRAYVELARIRLAAALATPRGAGRRLDPFQTDSVLGLLRTIRARQPPQSRAYLLVAETLEHSSDGPTSADWAMLKEGLRYFPENASFTAAFKLITTRYSKSQ